MAIPALIIVTLFNLELLIYEYFIIALLTYVLFKDAFVIYAWFIFEEFIE